MSDPLFIIVHRGYLADGNASKSYQIHERYNDGTYAAAEGYGDNSPVRLETARERLKAFQNQATH
jgi:hypothetical protein